MKKYKFDPDWMKDPIVMEQVFKDMVQEYSDKLEELKQEIVVLKVYLEEDGGMLKFYLKALREIDTHIRATREPVPYIIDTLKETLPEYDV
jgi:hypothetical protein